MATRTFKIPNGAELTLSSDELEPSDLALGVTSRARGSRWARSEMTRAVGTLPSWPGRG